MLLGSLVNGNSPQPQQQLQQQQNQQDQQKLPQQDFGLNSPLTVNVNGLGNFSGSMSLPGSNCSSNPVSPA